VISGSIKVNILNIPEHILDIRSTRPLSNPAITVPPTGTKKFLSCALYKGIYSTFPENKTYLLKLKKLAVSKLKYLNTTVGSGRFIGASDAMGEHNNCTGNDTEDIKISTHNEFKRIQKIQMLKTTLHSQKLLNCILYTFLFNCEYNTSLHL
jgi:hypothetical protein